MARGLGGSAILTNNDPHLLTHDGAKILLAVSSTNRHVLVLHPLRPAMAAAPAVDDVVPTDNPAATDALAVDHVTTPANDSDPAIATAPDATTTDVSPTPSLTISRSSPPALMSGLVLDGDCAHQVFAHAAAARLGRILSHYGLAPVGPACRLHCQMAGPAAPLLTL